MTSGAAMVTPGADVVIVVSFPRYLRKGLHSLTGFHDHRDRTAYRFAVEAMAGELR
jgi:hypothetical protein